MAFKQRSGGSSVLSKVSSGFAPDPKELNYKLNVGDGTVVRFLSLHEDDTFLQANRYATIQPNDEKKEPFETTVPDPGDAASKIMDDAGVALEDCPLRDILFVPVWVLYTVNKDGTTNEEINELKYMRMGPGLSKEIKKLQEDVKNEYDFEDVPDYDVRIEVVKKSAYPSYELFPVLKVFTAPEKRGGKITKEDSPRFRVADLREALGDDVMAVIDEEFDALVEHFTKIATEEAKPDKVKKRFLRYRNSGDATTAGKGMRRNVPAEEEEVEVEDTDTDSNEEEVEEQQTGGTRFSGMKRGK